MSSDIIAIDGVSASGKGTVSKLVARRLRARVLDSGSLYRAVTLLGLRKKIRPKEHTRRAFERLASRFVAKAVKRIKIVDGHFLLDGKCLDQMEQIRTEQIDDAVAYFAELPCVRKAVLPLQYQFADGCKLLVTEGRDMTTVVFPHAKLRIFLKASIEAGAWRRTKQYQAAGKPAEFGTVLDMMYERDRRDRLRTHSPVMIAEGVHVINTNNLSAREVADRIIALWQQGCPPPAPPAQPAPPQS